MLLDIDDISLFYDVRLFDTISFNIRCDYNLSIGKEPREM
jgi:hypothetical protein